LNEVYYGTISGHHQSYYPFITRRVRWHKRTSRRVANAGYFTVRYADIHPNIDRNTQCDTDEYNHSAHKYGDQYANSDTNPHQYRNADSERDTRPANEYGNDYTIAERDTATNRHPNTE
jgi:hypothetical protein